MWEKIDCAFQKVETGKTARKADYLTQLGENSTARLWLRSEPKVSPLRNAGFWFSNRFAHCATPCTVNTVRILNLSFVWWNSENCCPPLKNFWVERQNLEFGYLTFFQGKMYREVKRNSGLKTISIHPVVFRSPLNIYWLHPLAQL